MAATYVLFKGALTGPSPVDRAKTGSKHHLIVDSHGIPLAITLTGGNRNDVTQLLPHRWCRPGDRQARSAATALRASPR
jgi:hypothetical protein